MVIYQTRNANENSVLFWNDTPDTVNQCYHQTDGLVTLQDSDILGKALDIPQFRIEPRYMLTQLPFTKRHCFEAKIIESLLSVLKYFADRQGLQSIRLWYQRRYLYQI